MLLVGFFGWWYRGGWRGQVARIGDSLVRINDWFSIPLLLKTFFAPWRQISANEIGNDPGSNLRAWGDLLFSRVIGAFMRFFMIIFGFIALILVLIVSLIRLILWPLFPFVPAVGVLLMLRAGVPWNLL
ncbi:hypothetical protein FWC31_00215 [Candidatus Saccharibacteria bacterium]|nr:hypothetical protein [Candidatus Saccharibacteria bacterium]